MNGEGKSFINVRECAACTREVVCVLTRWPPLRRGECECGKLPETCDFVSQVILKIMHTHKCVCFLQNRKL